MYSLYARLVLIYECEVHFVLAKLLGLPCCTSLKKIVFLKDSSFNGVMFDIFPGFTAIKFYTFGACLVRILIAIFKHFFTQQKYCLHIYRIVFAV
jgi:hypothetical protein